jgi:nucleoside-triphosphatase THEP1
LGWKQGNIMALEKVSVVDRIEVIENGAVQVRTVTRIMEDGKQLVGSFHRHVVAPGDDYSKQDVRVKAICAATHTAAVVAEYKAAQAAATP